MADRISFQYNRLIIWFEMILAVVVFVGIIAHAIGSLQIFLSMNWRAVETLYEFISRILLLVIGLEFIRILLVRDLVAVLELLAFVIARKILKPDLTAIDLAISVIAFVSLLAARYFLTAPKSGK